MSIWQFLENRAVSDQGKTIQRVTENTSISSDSVVFSKLGESGYRLSWVCLQDGG